MKNTKHTVKIHELYGMQRTILCSDTKSNKKLEQVIQIDACNTFIATFEVFKLGYGRVGQFCDDELAKALELYNSL